MVASPISLGISIWLGILGLLGLWKVQHRLDRRGYLVQAALIITGIVLIIMGAPPRTSATAVGLFDCGVVLVGVFLLFPEILYWLLLFYDRRSSRWRR